MRQHTERMRRWTHSGLLVAAIAAVPARAAHDGPVAPRTMPELSDLALALFAVGAIWFVRRALRARFRREAPTTDPVARG